MNNVATAWVRAVTDRAPWGVHVAAFSLFAMQLLWYAISPDHNLDNAVVVDAVRRLSDGVSPYTESRMLYPPSSIPFALLEAPLPDPVIRFVGPFLVGLFLLVGWWAALRMFGISLRSWLAALAVAAAVFFNPATGVALLGSWTAPVAAATPLALLYASRNRWLLAGVIVGVSIAVKPMLVPVGLIFLLARQWKALALAAGIPLLLCAMVMVVMPQPELFFTKTVPFLLSGQDSYSFRYDSSLPTMLPRLGMPDLAVTITRIVVAGTAVGAAVSRWLRGSPGALRLVETTAILMIGTFLVSTPAFPHYAMVVVPMLIAGSIVEGSAARSVWFWLSLIPLTSVARFLWIDYLPDGSTELRREAFRVFVWLLVTFPLLVLYALRRRPGQWRSAAGIRPLVGRPHRGP